MMPIKAMRLRAADAGGGTVDLATAILADSPWAYWQLDDDTSATAANDSSGNARHLTGLNVATGKRLQTPLIADGGYSMLFDPANISGTLTGFTGHNPLSAVSLVKPTSLASARAIIHNGDYGVGGGQGQFLAINTNGGIYVQIVAGGTYTYASANGSIAVNETALIGFSHDPTADEIVIYKNGAAIHTVSHTAGLGTSTTTAWKIGDLTGTGAPMNGYIDHTAVFSGVLSPARWLAHAQAAGLA